MKIADSVLSSLFMRDIEKCDFSHTPSALAWAVFNSQYLLWNILEIIFKVVCSIDCSHYRIYTMDLREKRGKNARHIYKFPFVKHKKTLLIAKQIIFQELQSFGKQQLQLLNLCLLLL